jgi:hypothetical protein
MNITKPWKVLPSRRKVHESGRGELAWFGLAPLVTYSLFFFIENKTASQIAQN